MNKFTLKLLMVALFLLMLLLEWRKGQIKIAPSRLQRADWRLYGKVLFLFTSLSIGISFLDPVLVGVVQGIRHPLFAWVADGGGWLGRSVNLWFVLAAGYFIFLIIPWFRRRFEASRIFSCLLSVALASIFSSGIKRIFLRARPDAHQGHLSFLNFSGLVRNETLFQSFPSGDVVIVAAAAAYLLLLLKKGPWRWLLLLLPLATALSRIDGNRHWPSDTVFSIGLGLLCSLFIFQFQNFPVKPPAPN